MGAERRTAARKPVDSIHVAEITSLNTYTQIASEGNIVDASSRGFLIVISRNHFMNSKLKQNLTLDSLIGQRLALYLPQMQLDLDGTVSRASHIGKGFFEVAVEFGEDVPEYWRECLVDLLPSPDEAKSTL